MRAEKRKKKPKWLKVIGILFLVLLIGGGGYAFMVYKSLTDAVETMHQPIDREKSDKRTEKITLAKKEPFSVLMLGVDERSGDKGRSDTMIVLTVNPNDKSIKMLSIPRDTRTEIVGKGFEDKINHAYAFGNEEMSMATVENFLDIPLDYYIKVNMEGFKDIVDAVGGITVNSSLSFNQGAYQFTEGSNNLDGDAALAYVQMRKQDPKGDFGRQDRQRQIIQGVIKKGISVNSLTNFDDIFGALGKNVRTNMTFAEMKDIQKNYRDAAGNIEQMTMSGNGQTLNKIWYLIISSDEQQRVQNELKAHLNLK
ncbi:LytR family transcriptional regulator [Cytobacillus oceanisediminis]|uniref:polyisoprenyl-teichoic acid--peptidoglycan teichoic acid transferase TagU n=1 Tax=Cytobacillus TaxID=2675230 RepID=UPI002042063D|nr:MULTISPECIES: LytR family transcriptional regulator [Cytobacillus]MBY0158833.1 LytR family transcriptional regulator [Cytobacillus firmus]MCM3391487.1 LytR family transcriptional regulator [Cytobacillus oceanisediminis]MCM3529098.1 LytR family transcriptional regulator [Cytobacillus oceanisediminis]UQX53802.1 LytR family transcriptional regulator [Cytobacillus pseudoceanisediminis]